MVSTMFGPVILVFFKKLVLIKLVYSDHKCGVIILWRQAEDK